MNYQIIDKKLPRHFDIYLYGYLIKNDLYIYQIHKRMKNCLFYGNLDALIKEIATNVKRKVTKNGEPVTDEDRVRIRWNKRRRVDRIVG